MVSVPGQPNRTAGFVVGEVHDFAIEHCFEGDNKGMALATFKVSGQACRIYVPAAALIGPPYFLQSCIGCGILPTFGGNVSWAERIQEACRQGRLNAAKRAQMN